MNSDLSSQALMQTHLACPACHSRITIEAPRYVCTACAQAGEIRENVFLAKPVANTHYFDDMHRLMQTGNQSPEIREMCYEQQSRILTEMIRPGDVIVDIGCGPVIHFDRPKDCVLIGVDPSFDSIRVNTKLDIRVFGSAASVPLRDDSVDRVSLFYSVHHMIGNTVEENAANVTAALRECGRVIRPGGTLVVFDMSPWWPFWHAQRLGWNRARQSLSGKLDMFFWRDSALRRLGEGAFGKKTFESEDFKISPFLVFPPVFSRPELRVPRFLYPFDIKMYKWSF